MLYKSLIPNQQATIYLVGCGGTGSFLAQDIARIAYHLKNKSNIKIWFIDSDVVEKKNVGRQNFVESEIGQNKASVLAVRYNRAYGLSIISMASLIQDIKIELSSGLNLFVGAVDNAFARKYIANYVVKESDAFFEDEFGHESKTNIFWLDCGNANDSGQVLIGNASKPDRNTKSQLLGLLPRIPFPHLQAPDLIKKQPKPKLSCAELAIREEQSLLVNRAMATFAAQYLYDFFVKKELTKYSTYISLGGCAASSKLLSPDMWNGIALKKKEKTVKKLQGHCHAFMPVR